MKLVREIILILLFVVIGEFLYKVVHIPIPGNILGMILLLGALMTGIIKLEHIEGISHFLLSHLAIFFIPASVGLLGVTGILKGTWYILLLIAFISTLIVMVTTAVTVNFLRRWIK